MRQINAVRVATGLVLAAITGGLVLGAELWLAVIITALPGGQAVTGPAVGFGLLLGLLSALYAAVVFIVGLLVIGVPVWLALDGLGMRSRRVTTLVGALLSTGAAYVLLAALGAQQERWMGIWLGVFLILPGAAAGWTLHRVAYGPNPNP